MNKSKLVLAITGGVIGLAVVAVGIFTYLAFVGRTAALEGDEDDPSGLDVVMEKARTLSKKTVFPSVTSVKAIASNRVALIDWCQAALKQASMGDRIYEATTPPAFKSYLVDDARRLSALTNASGSVMLKKDFAFGPFKSYIVEGQLPQEAQLAELQRQWDDIVTVIEILAQQGAAELSDVALAVAKEEEPADAAAKARAKKRAKQPAKKKAKGLETKEPSVQKYTFSFAARPAALVKVLNALAVCERFITVEELSLARSSDALATALGGEKKEEESAAGGSSRRSRRAARRAAAAKSAAEEEAEQGEKKSAVVTDPLTEPPLKATMTLAVTDFRSLESEAEPKAEETKEVEK